MKVFVKKNLYTVNVGRYTSIIFKSLVNYDELKMFWIKVDTKAGYPQNQYPKHSNYLMTNNIYINTFY